MSALPMLQETGRRRKGNWEVSLEDLGLRSLKLGTAKQEDQWLTSLRET